MKRFIHKTKLKGFLLCVRVNDLFIRRSIVRVAKEKEAPLLVKKRKLNLKVKAKLNIAQS